MASVNEKKLAKQWRSLDARDRRACRRWMLGAVKRLLQGEFADWYEVLDDATAKLKPKAIDWPAILAFIQGLQPIIEAMIAMCEEQ
jgi:hypothetical protein